MSPNVQAFAHGLLEVTHLAAKLPPFTQECSESPPVPLAGLVQPGIGDRDGGLRGERLEPSQIEGIRRVVHTEPRRIKADHPNRLLAVEERNHEDRREAGRVNASGVIPPVFTADGGHEYHLA